MANMDVWTWLLAAVGGFVAVTTLVRLMRRRRDQLFAELTAEAQAEQERQRIAEAQQRLKQRKVA